MPFKDFIERVKSDVTHELQQPARQQDIERVKTGFREALAGARSLSEGVIDRTRNGESAAAVVVDDPAPPPAPVSDDTGVRIEWHAWWNRGFGERPTTLASGQFRHAVAVSSVHVLDGETTVARFTADEPVRLTEVALATLRTQLGQAAWEYEGLEDDRAAAVGRLMASCTTEQIVARAKWEMVDSLPAPGPGFERAD